MILGDNKAVRRETIDWRTRVEAQDSRPHYDLDPPPSHASPVVLHLFGTDEDPLFHGAD